MSTNQSDHPANTPILWFLSRYVKKIKTDEPGTEINMTPRYDNRKIFTNEQESQLGEYLLACSKMNFPLSTIDCRRLAYETAIKNNLKIPDTRVISCLLYTSRCV